MVIICGILKLPWDHAPVTLWLALALALAWELLLSPCAAAKAQSGSAGLMCSVWLRARPWGRHEVEGLTREGQGVGQPHSSAAGPGARIQLDILR